MTKSSYCESMTDEQVRNIHRQEHDRMLRYGDRTDKVGREIHRGAVALVRDAQQVMAQRGKEL